MEKADYQMMYQDQSMNAMEKGLAQNIGGGLLVFYLAILIYYIVIYWKLFTKAGQAGWKIFIPIYNMYVLLQIVNRPGWWLMLYLIPVVNLIIAIIVMIDLGKAFGKDAVWSIFLLILFPIIGLSIIAFSGAKYTKPKN